MALRFLRDGYFVGKVGIGTNNPSYPLDITGFANSSSGFRVTDGTIDNRISWSSGNVGFFGTLSPHPITLNTGGAERMRILSNGYVGIGMSSPDEVLEVKGIIKSENTGYTNTGIIINQTSHADAWRLMQFGGGAFSLNLNGYTGGESRFQVDTSGNVLIPAGTLTVSGTGNSSIAGNVGIGTTSPTSNLEIVGNGGTVLDVQGSQGQLFSVTDSLSGSIFAVSDISGVPILDVNSSGTSYFSGDVGIGTASPSRPLSVQSSATSIIADFKYASAAYSSIDLSNTVGTARISSVNNDLLLSPGMNERMRITSAGNVGIGVTGPSAKLQVLGNVIFDSHSTSDPDSTSRTAYPAAQMFTHYTEANGVSIIGGAGGYSGASLTIGEETGRSSAFKFIRGVSDTNGGASAGEEFWVNGIGGAYFAGNVGIGTTSPDSKFEVVDQNPYGGILITGGNAPGLTIKDQSSTSESKIYVQSVASPGSSGNLRISADNNNTALNPTIEFRVGNSEKMRITDAGAIRFNSYTAGTLVTDSSGNITVSSGGGAGGPYLPLAGGTMTGTNGVLFPDNFILNIGSSSDLKISHDGTDSFIEDSGTGSLYVTTNAFRLLNPAENEQIITAFENGAVNLFYDSSQKFETTTFGSKVTGYIQVTSGVDVTGGNIDLVDNSKIRLGTSQDLQIYHDGSNSYINEVGTGVLSIQSDGTEVQINKGASEYMARFITDGAVNLYYDNSKKFETTNTGVTVTGSAGISIQGTNATGAESILVQGFASTDTLGSIRTANTGGYNQQMRFYTSDITGQPENLTLTLQPTTNASFEGNVDLGDSSNITMAVGAPGQLQVKGSGYTGAVALDATAMYIYHDSALRDLVLGTNETARLTISGGSGNTAITGVVTAPTFSGDLNGTINTVTTAVTKANATNDTTVATTAFVQNLIGTIPAGLVFQGTWNAATNTPTLTSGTGTTGHFYIVSTSGNTNLDGVTDWVTGDWAVFIEQGGTDEWEKIDNSSVLDGAGTGQTLPLWSGSGTSNTLTDSRFTQTSTSNQAKAPAGANTRSFEALDSGGNSDFHVLGSGEVIIPNNYLFVSAGQGAYFTGSIRARGGVSNDQGTLGLGGSNSVNNLTLTSNTLATFAGNIMSTQGGTAALPKITLSASTTTGIYTPVANGWGVSTDGVSRLVIDASGNVGIGTTAPTQKLVVNTNATAGIANLSDIDKTSGNLVRFTNPQYSADASMGILLRVFPDSDVRQGAGIIASGGGTNEQTNLSLFVSTDGVGTSSLSYAALTAIGSSGNVGIGTTSPFTNATNTGLNIDTGGHSSLLIGDGVNTGGMIQSSDNQQRVIIGANAYDSPTASWSRFTADGAALIDVYGEGSSAFISLNVDDGTSGYPSARLVVSNSGNIKFNAYSSTNQTGTPTYLLGTDGSGNIVKTNTVPGSAAGPYLPLTGGILTGGLANSTGGVRVLSPGGGAYTNQTPSITGAIKITLPVSWTNTMMRITIKVYEYITNEAFTIVCGGFNHTSGWVNHYAYIESSAKVDRNFTVRFGHDGTKCCVYIGELASTWTYPQVFVTDFEGGFQGLNGDTWRNGWVVGFEATAFGSITRTETNTQVHNWVRSGQDVYYGSGSGNVGIGTTNPTSKLHSVITTAGDSALKLQDDTGSVFDFQCGIAGVTGDALVIKDTTLSYDYLTLRSGNVGIGTTSPTYKLSVSTSASSAFSLNTGTAGVGNPQIDIYDAGRSQETVISSTDGTTVGTYIASYSNHPLLFGTNAGASPTAKMIIDSSGNVGIGTTSPTYKLTVSGGITAGGKITYTKSAGSLDTTGYDVAGLSASYNGQSACFTFTCFGHSGGYQKIVYSCYNAGGTWIPKKVINEGTNQLDVVASANGTTVTFTFRSISSTLNYTPRVTVEAVGTAIISTYA